MTPRLRLASVVLLTALTMNIGVTAQTPAPGAPRQEGTPTFRAGVKLIDIDVYVTDKEGQFVKDLTRDDFEIVEDGRPQGVQTFTFVDLPVTSLTASAPRVSVEQDITTNRETQGRLYVIVLDSPSTVFAPTEYVRGAAYAVLTKRTAERFVDDYLQPGDMAAVVHVQGSPTDGQPFTSSRELLRASIERYGRGRSGDNSDFWDDTVSGTERVQRHLDTYRALEDVAATLGAMTGRRKSILWVGAQMKFSKPSCPPNVPISSLPCQLDVKWGFIQNAHRDAMAVATKNNVAIYPIDPVGLTTLLNCPLNQTGMACGDELDRLAALRVVAEDTGGRAVVNTNNFRDGFTNIVRDNSTYYVLGYAPRTEIRDGKFHALTVRVKRPGLYTVRQRKGYTADAPAISARQRDQPTPPAGISVAARDALRMAVATRGLGVSFFNAPFKDDGRSDAVIIGGQITGELLLDGTQQVGLSYQVFTVNNDVQAGEYKTYTLNLQPDSRANATAHGLHFVDRLSLPPGRYEVRYAVDQPGGHVGSIVTTVIVPRFDEALSLSGVVLGSTATTEHVMLREDAGIRERLGTNPTSVRTFHRDDTVTAFAEVYSDDTRLTADNLTITGSLRASDGKVVAVNDGRLRSAVHPGDGRWAYSVEVDLADVPAGSYVMTIEAASTRHKEPLRRTIPISVAE